VPNRSAVDFQEFPADILTTMKWNLQCFRIGKYPFHCCFSWYLHRAGLLTPRSYRSSFTVRHFTLVTQYIFQIQELSVTLTTNSRTLSDNFQET